MSLFALSFRIYPQIFYLPRPNRVSIQRERERNFYCYHKLGIIRVLFSASKSFSKKKKTSRSINSFLEFFKNEKNSITLLSILDIIIIVIARNSEKPFLRVPLLDRSVHEFHERRKRFVYTRAILPRFITTLKRRGGIIVDPWVNKVIPPPSRHPFHSVPRYLDPSLPGLALLLSLFVFSSIFTLADERNDLLELSGISVATFRP